MATVLDVVLVLVGLGIVALTLLSAIRTVVVPRAEQVVLTGLVFAALRPVIDVFARLRRGYDWTDRVLAMYAPLALLSLPLVWLTAVFAGFALVFLGVEDVTVVEAVEVAGSSLLTLGFIRPETLVGELVAFVGAGLTIAIVVLLLVTYLPTMYSAFAERERAVVLLEARAGAPATGVELLSRLARIHGLSEIDSLWARWEDWFAAVQESHTSQPALAHFRSQRSDQHWVVAAGAVLDGAALYVACVDHEVASKGEDAFVVHGVDGTEQRVRAPSAELAIRAGYLCLRDVGSYFGLPFDRDPAPHDPIAITREEFDAALDEMAEAGVPLVADRDAAWQEWAGWRVNYDSVLLQLADFVAAPTAPWTSDRSAVGSHADRRRRRGPVETWR